MIRLLWPHRPRLPASTLALEAKEQLDAQALERFLA